ncbi:DUF1851 domain-containing protein [Oxalobacteraceae bacterium OTU3CAMAD1]|nr:DUF1851 domain-containing protein [Oxalobacteraceae bacterium OTU3CAMAD1]
MDEYFEMFLSDFGPQFSKAQPESAEIENFRGRLPNKLLEYWQIHGWGGYNSGLYWITNPQDYLPVVEVWLDRATISDKQNYFAIARTAFGRVFLWNKQTGQSVTIDSLSGFLITTPPDETLNHEDDTKALQYFISENEPDDVDFSDDTEKPLFKRALKKLGPLTSDEMYGFEPALCIGGIPKLENLVKVKIIEHLILLERLAEVEILHVDVRRHL